MGSFTLQVDRLAKEMSDVGWGSSAALPAMAKLITDKK